jgi:hypothetical protein
MPDYCAYILGREGHRFVRVAEFSSDHADDVTALLAAKQLIDGHDVELWDGGRLVARLNHEDGNPSDDFSRLTETPKLAKIEGEEQSVAARATAEGKFSFLISKRTGLGLRLLATCKAEADPLGVCTIFHSYGHQPENRPPCSLVRCSKQGKLGALLLKRCWLTSPQRKVR